MDVDDLAVCFDLYRQIMDFPWPYADKSKNEQGSRIKSRVIRRLNKRAIHEMWEMRAAYGAGLLTTPYGFGKISDELIRAFMKDYFKKERARAYQESQKKKGRRKKRN